MSRRKQGESAQASNVFQFTLAGLVVFSLALVIGASFVGFKLAANTTPTPLKAFVMNKDALLQNKDRVMHLDMHN